MYQKRITKIFIKVFQNHHVWINNVNNLVIFFNLFSNKVIVRGCFQVPKTVP
uniref:Uncharacterized protein n=1 Tax=Ciona intestinalis TaxID=7719 RepID=H2XXQ8_CIOIN